VGKIAVPILPLVAVTFATSMAAQQPAVSLGTRVRVSSYCRTYFTPMSVMRSGCNTDEGALVGMSGDTIQVTVNQTLRSYDVTKIARLEIPDGYESHWQTGAGIGFALGTGIAFYPLSGGPDIAVGNGPLTCYGEPAKCVALAVVLGGLPGALIGGLIGAAARTERWVLVPGSRIRMAVEPLRIGFGVGASLRL